MRGVHSDLLWSQEGRQSGEGGRVSQGKGAVGVGVGIARNSDSGFRAKLGIKGFSRVLIPAQFSRYAQSLDFPHPEDKTQVLPVSSCSPLPWTPSLQPSSTTLWPHQPASCPLDGNLRAFTCSPPQRCSLLPISPQPARSSGTSRPDTQ